MLRRVTPAALSIAMLSLGCGDGGDHSTPPADDAASAEDITDVAATDGPAGDVTTDASPMDSGATDGASQTGDASSDAAGDRAPLDVASDGSTSDATSDAVSDVASDRGATDVEADAAADVALDGAAPDAAADAATDVASDARPDVPTDVADAATDGGAGVACTSGAACGAGLCLLGRCVRYADESLPLASVPSPDRCRMRVGVDHPAGSPLRVITVVPASSGDTGYESVRRGASWTRSTLSTNVNRYTTPRFHRAPSGALEVDFVWGVTVALGARGSIMQSGFSDYEAAYSPAGELMAVVKSEGTGSFSHPYPLRLWRASGSTWSSDLVVSSVGTDGRAALHFRADGTPDVLVFDTTRVTLYRKALDVWTPTPLFTGPGTHAGGAVALHDPRGGTHVFFGTQVFTVDPSVGELTVDYLYVAPDGTLARRERLPVGGHGFSLRDATLAADGRAYAMIVGPASGGRYPTHVVRVDAAGVTSSVVANFETATTVCSLAVAPDATMYLAAYQGYTRPVLLRTYTP